MRKVKSEHFQIPRDSDIVENVERNALYLMHTIALRAIQVCQNERSCVEHLKSDFLRIDSTENLSLFEVIQYFHTSFYFLPGAAR